MFGLIYQAGMRFFTVMCSPLNKTEKDQPLPLEVQREELIRQINEVEKQIRLRKAWLDSNK